MRDAQHPESWVLNSFCFLLFGSCGISGIGSCVYSDGISGSIDCGIGSCVYSNGIRTIGSGGISLSVNIDIGI